MSLDAVKILEISITINPKNEILEFVQKSLINGAKKTEKIEKNASFAIKFLTIVTPNPEQIVLARRDSHFKKLLNQADISIPDGNGVVWASRIFSLQTATYNLQAVQQVIPGIEFMEELVVIAAKQHVPVALIGGKDGLALKTFECLSMKHPKLLGWAGDGPEVRIDKDEIQIISQNTDVYFSALAKRIVDSGVKMVFVGLGAPKQEYFIERLRNELSFRPTSRNLEKKAWDDKGVIIFMSVGGSFDEIAQRIPRAPQWVSGLGLKWLWRLILEPWRIRRQLALVNFVWLVLREKKPKKIK